METFIVIGICIAAMIGIILVKRHAYYWTFDETPPPLFHRKWNSRN
jgi:hypothetical protein